MDMMSTDSGLWLLRITDLVKEWTRQKYAKEDDVVDEIMIQSRPEKT